MRIAIYHAHYAQLMHHLEQAPCMRLAKPLREARKSLCEMFARLMR